jgi:hypothetical protein
MRVGLVKNGKAIRGPESIFLLLVACKASVLVP